MRVLSGTVTAAMQFATTGVFLPLRQNRAMSNSCKKLNFCALEPASSLLAITPLLA